MCHIVDGQDADRSDVWLYPIFNIFEFLERFSGTLFSFAYQCLLFSVSKSGFVNYSLRSSWQNILLKQKNRFLLLTIRFSSTLECRWEVVLSKMLDYKRECICNVDAVSNNYFCCNLGSAKVMIVPTASHLWCSFLSRGFEVESSATVWFPPPAVVAQLGDICKEGALDFADVSGSWELLEEDQKYLYNLTVWW